MQFSVRPHYSRPPVSPAPAPTRSQEGLPQELQSTQTQPPSVASPAVPSVSPAAARPLLQNTVLPVSADQQLTVPSTAANASLAAHPLALGAVEEVKQKKVKGGRRKAKVAKQNHPNSVIDAPAYDFLSYSRYDFCGDLCVVCALALEPPSYCFLFISVVATSQRRATASA